MPREGPGAPRDALSSTGTKLNSSGRAGAEPAAPDLGKGHKEALEQGRSKSRHPVWGRGKMSLCKAATEKLSRPKRGVMKEATRAKLWPNWMPQEKHQKKKVSPSTAEAELTALS